MLSSPTTPPSVDRSTKPPSINHLTSIGSSSDNAYGLRTVMVPKQLMDKFLKIAESNTLANIETCGILAGKIVSRIINVANQFHLILFLPFVNLECHQLMQLHILLTSQMKVDFKKFFFCKIEVNLIQVCSFTNLHLPPPHIFFLLIHSSS